MTADARMSSAAPSPGALQATPASTITPADLESLNRFNYAEFYDRIAARQDFTVFVELGCWKGHSLRHLAQRLRQRAEAVCIYGVDLWEARYLRHYAPSECRTPDALYEIYSANLAAAGVRDLVTDIRTFSWEAAEQFEDDSVDFVYIDADHAYPSVIKDIRAWLPKIRAGGVISGHNYFSFVSVRRAVDGLFGDRVRSRFPVWWVDVDSDLKRPDALPQLEPLAADDLIVNPRVWTQRRRLARVRAGIQRRRVALGRQRFRRTLPDSPGPIVAQQPRSEWTERVARLIERFSERAQTQRSVYDEAAGPAAWVDIIVLVFNEYEYLVEALESVVAQTCTLFRLTLVDNGSTRSATVDLLNRLRTLRPEVVQVVSTGRPIGVVAARNLGAQSTDRPYILMLDADDVLHPACVHVMLHALQDDPVLGAVYCDFRLFGEKTGEVRMPEYNLDELLRGNFMTVTSMYRRPLWHLVGGYSPEMEGGYEDWEFWIKLAEGGWYAKKVPGLLLNVRVKPESRNAAAIRRKGRLVDRIRRLHPNLYDPARRAAIARLWNEEPDYDPNPRPSFEPVSKEPLVSIVIPCYKYGRYVRQTVDSCLDQTYKNIEILVCDDGSPDAFTQEVLASIQHPRVRVFRQPNQGLAQSRNNAIGLARGELILPLDADDLILPQMVERCVAELKRDPMLGFVYTDILFFDEQHGVHLHRPFNLYLELINNHATVCAMFRKEAWLQAGGYNPNMREGMEDWNFWVSMARIHALGRLIPQPLFAYRLHGVSMSTDTVRHRDRLVSRIRTNNATLYRPRSAEAIRRAWQPRVPEDRDRSRPNLPLHGPAFRRAADTRCLFSVIVPSFGHFEFLDRCLASVFNQTERDWELIVVEDACGDDRINRRLQAIAVEHPNVTVLFNPRNAGISRTLNRGIKHARGEYLCFLDCDDELTTDALARLRICMETGPAKHYVSTQRINMTDEGVSLHVVGRPQTPADLMHGNHAGHLKAVHRDVFQALGGFNPVFDGCQDYEHVMRVQEHRPVTYLNEALYRYRWHVATQSVAAATRQEERAERVRRHAQLRALFHNRSIRKGRLFGLIVVAAEAGPDFIDPSIQKHFNVEFVSGVSCSDEVEMHDGRLLHPGPEVAAALADEALNGRFVYFADPNARLSEATFVALLCRMLSIPNAASVTPHRQDAAGRDLDAAALAARVLPGDTIDPAAPWEYLRLARPPTWPGTLFTRESLSALSNVDANERGNGTPTGSDHGDHLYAPDAPLMVRERTGAAPSRRPRLAATRGL